MLAKHHQPSLTVAEKWTKMRKLNLKIHTYVTPTRACTLGYSISTPLKSYEHTCNNTGCTWNVMWKVRVKNAFLIEIKFILKAIKSHSSSSSSSSDFLLTCRYKGHIHNSGPLPGNWLAARMADLTPDLQVSLSWGSIAESFHSLWFLSVSYFQVILGLPGPRFPLTCMS